MTSAVISFAVPIMVTAGMLSLLRKRRTTTDYLLASRGASPFFTALSLVGTSNGGHMSIGVIVSGVGRIAVRWFGKTQ